MLWQFKHLVDLLHLLNRYIGACADAIIIIDSAEALLYNDAKSLLGFIFQDHQLFDISGGLGALKDDAEGLSYDELQQVRIVVALADPCLL